MTDPTPPRGTARTRLLETARDMIRARGFAASSLDAICATAGVTKGAFFHHFPSKEALGVAVADFWGETTGGYFATAPYHDPRDPVDRVLAYVAFRRALISADLPDCTCLAGTLVQETYASSPAIRDACAAAMLNHAATLTADLQAALTACHLTSPDAATPDAASLARHTQTVLQGAFVMAKATNDPDLAREALDHLDRYFRLLFNRPPATGGPAQLSVIGGYNA